MAQSDTPKNLAAQFEAGLTIFAAVLAAEGLLFNWARMVDDVGLSLTFCAFGGTGAGVVRWAGGGRSTGIRIVWASIILSFFGWLALWHAGSKDADVGALAPLFHISTRTDWNLIAALFAATIAACGILVGSAAVQTAIEFWRAGNRRWVVMSMLVAIAAVVVVLLFVIGGSLLSTGIAWLLARVHVSSGWSQPPAVVIAVLAAFVILRSLYDHYKQGFFRERPPLPAPFPEPSR